MSDNDYNPPASGVMKERQNSNDALRLLLAQRHLYSRAKIWQSIRWSGIAIIGVGAPFASLLAPETAVGAGALAGVWLFVGRTVLTWLESQDMSRAACLQEEVDQYIFRMPTTVTRAERPTPEQVALLAGDSTQLESLARHERLLDWYPIDAQSSAVENVAISQRSNAEYTARLIRTTVTVWAIAVFTWLSLLVLWASIIGTSLADFLLGVAFPLLPAFLDVAEYVLSTARASRDRADLARSIHARLQEGQPPIEGQELLVWQERLFDLRRTTPQVPDWLYKLTRKRNERAMKIAAEQLRRRHL